MPRFFLPAASVSSPVARSNNRVFRIERDSSKEDPQPLRAGGGDPSAGAGAQSHVAYLEGGLSFVFDCTSGSKADYTLETESRVPAPHAINSSPHEHSKDHHYNDVIDQLTPAVYARFFEQYPDRFSPKFVSLMQAVPWPEDAFAGTADIVSRCTGEAYTPSEARSYWNSTIRPVSEPLCRFVGFTNKLQVTVDGAKGSWMNILTNVIWMSGHWRMRLRPALAAFLAEEGFTPTHLSSEGATGGTGGPPTWRRQAEIARMARLIQDRVRRSGQETSCVAPDRHADPADVLRMAIARAWDGQEGVCALCDRPLLIAPANPMLQPSVDRIDSANAWYDAANLQVTHLACNRAKNDATDAQFQEFLELVRG